MRLRTKIEPVISEFSRILWVKKQKDIFYFGKSHCKKKNNLLKFQKNKNALGPFFLFMFALLQVEDLGDFYSHCSEIQYFNVY